MICRTCKKEIDTEWTEDKISQCEQCWTKGSVIEDKWWSTGDQGRTLWRRNK